MSLELVINYTKKIESLLERKLKAEGRGLHEKATSVASQLNDETLRSIRSIATIRNKLVHEDGFDLQEVDAFLLKCEGVIEYLEVNEFTLVDQTIELKDCSERTKAIYPYVKKVADIFKKLLMAFMCLIICLFGLELGGVGGGLLGGILSYFLIKKILNDNLVNFDPISLYLSIIIDSIVMKFLQIRYYVRINPRNSILAVIGFTLVIILWGK